MIYYDYKFLQNIDQAFFRRINYVVHFALPDYNHRKQIWEKIYPKTVPVTDNIDFDFLAKNFEISGGNIKNIALLAAFMAASEPEIKNQEVSMKHILKSLEHGCVLEGLTNKKERDKIGAEGDK